jgi:hypothetical protein
VQFLPLLLLKFYGIAYQITSLATMILMQDIQKEKHTYIQKQVSLHTTAKKKYHANNGKQIRIFESMFFHLGRIWLPFFLCLRVN